MYDAFAAHAAALVTDLSLTSVEESPVAEMLVSKVALLGFMIVVSVRGDDSSNERNQRAQNNMSPTSEDSSGRRWHPSLRLNASTRFFVSHRSIQLDEQVAKLHL